MSFANKILPRLGQSPENEEWYVNAIWKSLNEYMADIESAMYIPQFIVSGITTVPSSPPVPTPVMAHVGKVCNNRARMTYNEVKTAMWCGDSSLTFPNLFKLFARQLVKNFHTVISTTVVSGITSFTFDAITPYTTNGAAFMAEIQSIGSAGIMTPEIFHNTLSKYLDMAFKSIIPITIPYVGKGIVPVGAFAGTVTIAFQQVVIP